MSLLYTGRTENISVKEIEELNVVSDLLKISSLTLSRVETSNASIGDLSDVESDQKLSIEVIEQQQRKRPSKANRQAFLKEEDESSATNLIRRSKRAKIKNKKLNDFETPLKATSTDESQLKGTICLFL